MTGVHYSLADFVTRRPILDLPVMEGADWAAQLNRPDAVGCMIELKDDAAKKLDVVAAAAAAKTVLYARTDDDEILAWGVLNEPEWDEDAKTLSLSATGVLGGYFGETIIAPASALVDALTVLGADGFDVVNPALNTTLAGWSLGTIGKKLVEQWLAWPGAPSFILPADIAGEHEREYLFAALKSVSSAIDDLMQVEGGPDFAFDARRASDGLLLEYVMRHGTDAEPRLGSPVGTWSLGGDSPITGLKASRSAADMGDSAWMTAGKSAGDVLLSRARNEALLADGYPPRAIVDTSRNDVSVQATLDAYNAENISYGSTLRREISFNVRGDATPRLGQYRPGDLVALTVPEPVPAGSWVEQRRNRLANPSAEINTATWIAARATVARDTSKARRGAASFKVTTTDASSLQYFINSASSSDRAPVVGGETVSLNASVWMPTDHGARFQLYEYDAAGALLLPVTGTEAVPGVAGEWSDIEGEIVTKPETASARMVVLPVTVYAVGVDYWVDCLSLGEPGDYFDGDTAPAGVNERTRWLDEPGASPSIWESRRPAEPGHPFFDSSMTIRLTSISGDETGKNVKIGCVILDD